MNIEATNLRFAGEWTDATGTQHLRARGYEPLTGTFLTSDPYSGDISNPQSLHKYLYAHADPVNGVDPSGEIVAGIAVSIAAGALFGGLYGAANGLVGFYHGTYDLNDVWNSTISWAGTGSLAGLGVGGGVALVGARLAIGAFGIAGIGLIGADFLSPGTIDNFFANANYRRALDIPQLYVRGVRDVIRDQNHKIPGPLLASVLLAELNHYNILDTLGDDFQFIEPTARSIGPAQLRIDEMEDVYPGLNRVDLRHKLLDRRGSVEALADYFTYYLQDKPVLKDRMSRWHQLSEVDREQLVIQFTNFKDQHSFTTGVDFGRIWGLEAYHQIRARALVDN